jgi:EmrB/QacA subfamily drug resistance transporter
MSVPDPNQTADPRRWAALSVVLTASFMILLDISIVNVAIPTVQKSIHTSYTEIEFILVGYQMAYALMLITGGRLGDIFGRKRLFMTGVTGFVLASAACGLSQTGIELVVARIIQGVFAAMMYPQVLSVIQVAFPPRERAAAFGAFGAVIGIATISGPLAGGALIKLNILDAWRPIFLVNVPIGIGALVAATRFLHETKSPNAQRLDIPGTFMVTAALFLLVYPIVEGRDADWAAWTYICMAASVPVFVIFGFYTRWRSKHRGSPLVEPALFMDRAFVVGILLSAVFFAGIPSFFLTFSLYLQIGHPVGSGVAGYGFDAFAAGLTTLPFSVATAFASAMSIRLAPRFGKKIVQVGCVLLCLGMAGNYLVINANSGTGFHGYDLIPSLLVCGLGLGCVAAPLINIVLAGIHHGNAGSASGVLTTMQQVGGALGVAVVGVFFFGTLSNHAPTVNADRNATFISQLVAAGVPQSGAQNAASGFNQCFQQRAAEKDPSQVPEICTRLAAQQQTYSQGYPEAVRKAVSDLFTNEANTRLANNFTVGFENSVIADIAIFALAFFLVFLLPRPGNLGHRPPAGE